jgi:branched-chain amino acid transport system substrate-binding protein
MFIVAIQRCLAFITACIVIASTVAAVPLAAQNSSTSETIKIGMSLVTTDPAGITQLRGARMAVEEINAQGGVLGKKLEVVPIYNEKRDYPAAKQRIKTAIDSGTHFMITSGGSGMTLAAAEITIPNGVLLMTGSSSSPKITTLDDHDLVWRTIPSDMFQGRIAAGMMDERMFKTVGVIYLNNSYGNELFKAFQERFEQQDGKIIAAVPYPDAQSYLSFDFTPFVQQLLKDKPQVIYCITYGEDGAKIINTAKPYFTDTYHPELFGCDANYNNDFLFGANQRTIEGMMGLVYTHQKNYANYKTFSEAFKIFEQRGGSDAAELAASSLASLLGAESTSSYAANVYDAVYALSYAMLKAGSTKPNDVAAQLRNVTSVNLNATRINVGEFVKAARVLAEKGDINYNGASGILEFDASGDVISGSYMIWKVENGAFTEAGTLTFP